jgi:hypothetical protein
MLEYGDHLVFPALWNVWMNKETLRVHHLFQRREDIGSPSLSLWTLNIILQPFFHNEIIIDHIILFVIQHLSSWKIWKFYCAWTFKGCEVWLPNNTQDTQLNMNFRWIVNKNTKKYRQQLLVCQKFKFHWTFWIFICLPWQP